MLFACWKQNGPLIDFHIEIERKNRHNDGQIIMRQNIVSRI